MSADDKSTRKGFKFSRGRKVTDSETLSYDDANRSEDYVSINPSSLPKKRGRPRKHSLSEDETSSLKRSNSGDDVTASKKLHYPSTQFRMSDELSQNASDTHAEILVELMKEICKVEKRGLEQTLLSSTSNSDDNRVNELIKTLSDVLDSVPNDVRTAVSDDVAFIPELNNIEKARLLSLIETRQILIRNLETLEMYQDDILRLEQDTDLLLAQESISQLQEESGTAKSAENSFDVGIVERYREILVDMDINCDRILGSTEDAKNLMVRARQQQNKLYDKFNQTRMELASESTAPKDTRDLIRQLPNLY